MATHNKTETHKKTETANISNTRTSNPERRRFLRLLGAGGTAMAVGQVPFSQAATGEPIETNKREATPETPRYRETDHIRAFYATLD